MAIVGWPVALGLGAVALLRLVAHDRAFPLVVLNTFTTYLYLPAYLVLLAALATRRRALAALALALVACHLAWVLPGSVSAAPLPESARHAPHLRVMTANVLMVNERTDGIVGEILGARPDVLLVQEYSPPWRAALDEPRVRALLPYRVELVREDSFGTAILSRLRLRDAEVFDVDGLPMSRATVVVHGKPVRLYDVHTLPPRTSAYAAQWDRQLGALERIVAREHGALVVAGDFNFTQHARWFGRLTAAGLREAHADRGRGLATTWPNGIFPLPSVRLDHAFLSPGLACLGVREGQGAGSDHRPLVLDLAVL